MYFGTHERYLNDKEWGVPLKISNHKKAAMTNKKPSKISGNICKKNILNSKYIQQLRGYTALAPVKMV